MSLGKHFQIFPENASTYLFKIDFHEFCFMKMKCWYGKSALLESVTLSLCVSENMFFRLFVSGSWGYR